MQRPRATLNYYRYTTVGPKEHQGHRRTRGGIERETRGTGGHQGDSRDTKGTGGHSGGIARDTKTKRTEGNNGNGGIGSGRQGRGFRHAQCCTCTATTDSRAILVGCDRKYSTKQYKGTRTGRSLLAVIIAARRHDGHASSSSIPAL
jgi:hypothetical protein